MFKGFQNTSDQQQFKGFPNLNMQQATSAYGFSGVTFWLDAAYGLNTQTNGGAISTWVERIQGIPFTQSTAGSQPSLVLNDAAFNNLPTINTSSNRFLSSGTRGLTLNSSSTLVFIAKYDTLFTGNTLMGSSTQIGSLISLGATFTAWTGVGWRNSESLFFQSTVENSNSKICVLTLNNIIINGLNVLNNNSNTIFPQEMLNDIGAAAARNTFLNGKIAEILHYNYTLTSDEAIALSNNINQKYALY